MARQWPIGVAVAATVLLLLSAVRQYPDGLPLVAGLVALAVVGWWQPRGVAYGAAVLMATAVVGANAAVAGRPGPVDLMFIGWAAATVLAADVIRSARERASTRREYERLRAEATEREHRQRLTEERLRIARDLHDGVAHAMATVTIQAAAAQRLMDRRPGDAKNALEVVRSAGEDVLRELTAMVRVLRATDEDAPLAPAPDLAELPDLVRATKQAGLDVILTGHADRVSEAISRAAYRIVQEALTNVLRHAGPDARAEVSISNDQGLLVEIRDDGRGDLRQHRGSGAGISGMRERAAATGGTLSAGPASGDGFRVRAQWP